MVIQEVPSQPPVAHAKQKLVTQQTPLYDANILLLLQRYELQQH